jgi:Cation-independent mannose-6-phosphate receptor repeat
MQGSPEYLTSDGCDTYFEWYTIAACKSTTSPILQSTCYAFTDNGRKIDLSMLTRFAGAHSVSTYDGSTMYINVCRDISPGMR